MRAIIKIDGFQFGILSDKTIPAKNGFHYSRNIDIHGESGYFQASQATTLLDTQATTNGINGNTDLIKWVRYFPKVDRAFALGHDSGGAETRLYGYLGGKWTKIHTDSNDCNGGGFEEYGTRMYWASDTALGRFETATLKVNIDSSTTTISMTAGEIGNFPTTGDIVIDDEVMTYSGKYNNDLTGVSRGQNGTTAAAHTKPATTIGFTDSHQTFVNGDSRWHPMKVYLGKLNIGDGSAVATLESDDTFTAAKLTLPDVARARAMEVYNDLLTIGTWEGTSIGDRASSTLLTWDGVSTFPIQALTIKENGIQALGVWQNLLIVFAGIYGRAYAFNGATLTPIAQVPKIAETGNEWGEIYPDAVDLDVDGNLLFGFSKSGSTGDAYQIYKLGRGSSSDPMALTGAYTTSVGGTSPQIYSINNVTAGGGAGSKVMIGFLDTTYGIDSRANGSKYANYTPYLETQVYDISKNDKARPLKGVQLIMSNLTNGTARVRFDLDGNGSYVVLGEYDSQNQDQILKGINQRARQIQLKVDLECNSNVSPKIREIKIY